MGKSQQILSEDALKEKHASITGEIPDESRSSTSAGKATCSIFGHETSPHVIW
jgi:hypothetical protein